MAFFVEGYGAATWGGAPIAQSQNAPAENLDNRTDVHFGRNFEEAPDAPPAKPIHINLTDSQWAGIGPRIYDVLSRGGTVAEVLWFEWKRNPTSVNVTGFLSYFDDFHRKYNIVPTNTYGANANVAGDVPLTGMDKYQSGNKKVSLRKYEKSPSYKYQFLNGQQLGERWSKTALEWAREHGRVHFHLDGMGDLRQITDKQGHASHNVTSRELRYVYRHWLTGSNPFKGCVTFYNGYADGAKTRPQAVTCPWELIEF